MKKNKNIFLALALFLLLLMTVIGLNRSQVKVSAENINDSINLGTIFLKNKIAQENLFLSCKSTDNSPCPINNQGTPFAAFFVNEAIKSDLSPIEKEIISNQLIQEERNGLWGYSPEAPIDSDDTSFALQVFNFLNAPKLMEKILDFYNEQGKGFTTFRSNVSAELVFQPSENNNLHIHPEVNANIYNLLYGTPYENYINYDLVVKSQDPKGYWYSYFYPSNYYSTYQNLRLLSFSENYNDVKEKAINFLLNSQNDNGSWGSPGNAYETSLALKSLAILNVPDEQFWKGINFLLNSQNNDGSWKNSTVVWKYIRQQNPLVVWQAFDSNMIISTAFSISALKEAKKFEIP